MPKFIKFLHNDKLLLFKVDCIETIIFEVSTLQIRIAFSFESEISVYPFDFIDQFKQQCDAIMEQLEI